MSFYIYETTVEKKGDVEVNVSDAERIRARNAVAIDFVKAYRNGGSVPHSTPEEQLDIVIEQAERAQTLSKLHQRKINKCSSLTKENKRLREALEELRNLSMSVPTQYEEDGSIIEDPDNHFLYDFTTQALEGVSDDQTIKT